MPPNAVPPSGSIRHNAKRSLPVLELQHASHPWNKALLNSNSRKICKDCLSTYISAQRAGRKP